jgi:hypothetical protein
VRWINHKDDVGVLWSIQAWMSDGWVMDEWWMSDGWVMDEWWMIDGWVMDEWWMSDGWVMDEWWMSDGWVMDEWWMSDRWVMDDWWMSDGWAMDEWWMSDGWAMSDEQKTMPSIKLPFSLDELVLFCAVHISWCVIHFWFKKSAGPGVWPKKEGANATPLFIGLWEPRVSESKSSWRHVTS